MLKVPPKTHVGEWIEIEEGVPTGDPEILDTLVVALEISERNFEADMSGWQDRIAAIKKQIAVERKAAQTRKSRTGQRRSARSAVASG